MSQWGKQSYNLKATAHIWLLKHHSREIQAFANVLEDLQKEKETLVESYKEIKLLFNTRILNGDNPALQEELEQKEEQLLSSQGLVLRSHYNIHIPIHIQNVCFIFVFIARDPIETRYKLNWYATSVSMAELNKILRETSIRENLQQLQFHTEVENMCGSSLNDILNNLSEV